MMKTKNRYSTGGDFAESDLTRCKEEAPPA